MPEATVTPPCPVCSLPRGSCPNVQDGICRLLTPELQAHGDALLRFRRQRGAIRQPIWSDYNQLPQSMADVDYMWRIRSADVRNVLRLLEGRKQQRVVEVGPWNGWLTHHLARAGHQVTALGYSADDTDGLGAKRHYNVDWHAVQMDVSDLSQVQGRVDGVVINHGLHLFPDPLATVREARRLVKPGGVLVLLCLIAYRDPSVRRADLAALERACQAAVGVSHLLKPGRGYLLPDDLAALHEMGFTLQRYPHLWRSDIKARVRPQAPMYRWGWLSL